MFSIDLDNLQPKQYFTPAEANELLTSLRPTADALEVLAQRLREVTRDLDPRAQGTPEYLTLLQRSREIRDEAQDLVKQIQKAGVQIKAIDPILLDFPALLNGREVLLCWRSDEPKLGYWHGTHTGFSARSAIDKQPDGAWAWFS